MIGVVTYIYPNSMKYFDSFCQNLLSQCDQDFEVIFFNDGVDEKLFSDLEFKNRVIPISGTPIEIRFKSLEFLKQLPFNEYVFQDSDDLMSENRIKVVKRYLENYKIVSNDLNLMDDSGKIFEKSIWKNRLPESFEFDYNFIRDKNIVGLGNTALKKEILFVNLKYNANVKIADWFLFYQLLKSTNEKCVFTSECQTNYRQYDKNDAGIRELSQERLNQAINVINKQYEGLKEIGLENIEALNLKFQNIFPDLKQYFPFWWEEVKIINENKIQSYYEIN